MNFTSIFSDPELFKAQLEYSLESKEKFALVVPLLPAEIVQPVRDIILNLPSMNLFQELKREILNRTALSEFLRRLKELAGTNKENPIIRHIILSWLTEKWQHILAAVSDG